MRLYALKGSKEEALAQYGRLEAILLTELGTKPAASSRALKEEIAAGLFPPKDAGSPPAEPPGVVKHNLPAARTSFVGRQHEIVELKRELTMTRLLSLTGVGGSGKTRLALEVAKVLVGAYPDGVWLVELASLSEGDLLPQAVAKAAGVLERPGQPLTDTLAEYLRAKSVLLVVDNCEHLADSAADLLDTLLDSCPRLRVLATSREALGLAGEIVWRVPSLSVPETDSLPTPGEMTGYEAVRLFAERARLKLPAFELTLEDAPAVAEVCRKLEGIPLAIELATARMGTLSVRQISERLQDPLSLLSVGGRTAVSRQQTLRGTLDWSYELLGESERALFGRFSVFAGGWTLEAAEVVGTSEGTEEGDVLDTFSGLVDKSLVVAEARLKSRVRYRLLEPVRQYAREKLEEGGEAEEVRRRHASFFLTLAEEAEPRLRGPEDMEWLERLEIEHDNMRAALAWTLEREEAELAARLAGALMLFWEWHGHLSEGRRWLEEVLEKKWRVPAAVRAKALFAVCQMAHLQFDTDRAKAAALEGIELSAEAQMDGSLAAAFRWKLGYAARLRGDYERAQELVEESLAFSREADDKIGIADVLIELGAISAFLGDHERAREQWEEGVVLCRELGYGLQLANLLGNLGLMYLLEGDYERGAALNEEAAALSRERGYKGGIAFSLDMQGWVALLQGDHERAGISYRESLTLCKELGDKQIAVGSLDGLACISAAEEASERAAKLFGAAEVLGEAVGPLTPEEDALRAPYLVMARSQLDEASWRAAWVEGRAMSMNQAIDYALSEEEPIPPISPATKRPSADEERHLTRREREVAALVARGFTSRQIASQLVFSERTVDNHVAHILRKLSLHSREQIAARMAHQSPRRD